MKENVGQNIKKYRIAKGMKQEELCAGICSVSQLSKIETGKAQAKPEQIEALAKRLGETREELHSPDEILKELQHTFSLAMQALSQNQFEQAFELFREVIKTSLAFGYHSLYSRAAFYEAYLYEVTKQFPKAILEMSRLLESGIELDPDLQAEAFYVLGRSLMHNGDMGRALVFYSLMKQSVDQTELPEDAWYAIRLLHRLSDAMFYTHDYQIAYECGRKMREIALQGQVHLSSLRSRGLMAHGLLKQKRYAEASVLYEENLREAESNLFSLDIGVAAHNLGCIYLLTNDLPRARSFFERGLGYFKLEVGRYDYLLCEPYVELATVSVREGDFKQAEVLLERVEHIIPTTIGATYLYKGRVAQIRAEAALRNGQEEIYLHHLQAALAIYEQHTCWFEAYEVASELAECLEKQQDHNSALEMYRWAIEYDRRFESARNGRDVTK